MWMLLSLLEPCPAKKEWKGEGFVIAVLALAGSFSPPLTSISIRKDLLALNVKIFKVQGQALDQFAKKTCKILVSSLSTI